MILGIDPGSSIIGFGVIEGTRNMPAVHDYGVIITDKDASTAQKLLQLEQDLTHIVRKFQPKKAIVEELFFAKNVTTAILVAQSRGVILYVLEREGVPVVTYTPLQVKQGITGYGKATKKQIQHIVTKLLKLQSVPKPDDAADALALAWLGLH